MAIFVSYSSSDTSFVNNLAIALIKARTHVWIDRWEIKVGESLLDRIQAAISEASALLVVLSKASVASEWCRRELNAGLVRELEERRILVLPALVEDCEIPLFLREKLYADFRNDFQAGLNQVLAAVAHVTSDTRARIAREDQSTDWAMDWGTLDEQACLTFTFLQQQAGKTFSALTQLEVLLNPVADARLAQYKDAGLGWLGRHIVAGFLAEAVDGMDLRLLLSTKPDQRNFGIRDDKLGYRLNCRVTARLLGDDPGHDAIVNLGALLHEAVQRMRAASRRLTPEEERKVASIQSTPLGG
jgi:TIR domain-containing protein